MLNESLFPVAGGSSKPKLIQKEVVRAVKTKYTNPQINLNFSIVIMTHNWGA